MSGARDRSYTRVRQFSLLIRATIIIINSVTEGAKPVVNSDENEVSVEQIVRPGQVRPTRHRVEAARVDEEYHRERLLPEKNKTSLSIATILILLRNFTMLVGVDKSELRGSNLSPERGVYTLTLRQSSSTGYPGGAGRGQAGPSSPASTGDE